MKTLLTAGIFALLATGAASEPLNCNLTQYKPVTGLTAALEQDGLLVTWTGERDNELRARFGVDTAQPVIRELAIRTKGGNWGGVGRNLKPEYDVVSGRRRPDELRLRALRDFNLPQIGRAHV